MKKQVLSILQVNKDQYEQIVLDLYFEWCITKSKNEKTLQKVLTCVPLFNWWYKQLQNLERKFVYEGLSFVNHITPEAALDFYHSTTKDIMKLFSKPLIQHAYKS